jgi:tetratricopeptide (TPR) repeat protein
MCLRLFLAAAVGLPVQLMADSHPVAIVLATKGPTQFQWAKTSSWHPVSAGMVFSPGDTLRAVGGTIRFAFCPDKSTQTLLAGTTIVIPASGLVAAAGSALTDRTPIASCDLPTVPDTDGTMSRGIASPAFDAVNCAGQKIDLIEALGEVSRAHAAGDIAKELSTYQKISCYEGATWTRGVSAHLSNLPLASNSAQTGGETYALLIGISDYPAETPQGKLQFAHADAETFAEFLKQSRGGALPDDHIRLLTNKKATLAGLEQAVSSFVRDARNPKNTLIILLAGHGDYLPTRIDPDTKNAPFFLTYDSYAQEPETTGLRMSRFQEIISEEALAFHRVIALVDVCHAGHVEETSDRALPDAVRKVFSDNQGVLGLMMATGSHGLAYESEKFGTGHGAFTYAVLEGLNGKVPPNENHQITFDDLYNHVHDRVRWLTNNSQTPSLLDVRYDPVILENAVAGPALDLGEATKMPKEKTGRRERGKSEVAAEESQPAEPAESDLDRLLREDPLAAVPQVEANPANAELSERLRVALEDHGQQILIRYLRGEQNAMVKGDFTLCARYFEAALRRAPFDAFDESRMLFCQGRGAIFDRGPQAYADGMALLERSILLDPERGYAYNALGIAYLEQARGNANNYARAIDAFRDAIRFAPQWAYPLHNLALTYSEQGNFLAASHAYQLAMQLAPNYSYLPYSLGLLNQNINRLDDAEKYYRQAVAVAEGARRLGIEPTTSSWRERAVIWNALATVEIARKRFKEAQADLKRAQTDDPDLGAMKHNKALLLSRTGPSVEAERLWREVIRSDGSGFASRIALAEYLLRNHREAEAHTEFENLVVSLQLSAVDLNGGLPKLDTLRNHLPFDAALFELYGDAASHLERTTDATAGYDASTAAYRSKQDRQRVQNKRRALR